MGDSSLGRHAASGFTDEQVQARARQEAARAWGSEPRILVVRVDDERLSWPERELVRQLGDKLNGKGRR